MDSELSNKMRKARINMLLTQPFFGDIAIRLKLVEEPNLQIPTLATDGKNLYYHPEFVRNCNVQELVFGIAHEILHCAFEHFTRKHTRDSKIWNMAGDYAINFILKRDKIGKIIENKAKLNIGPAGSPTGILLNPKYENWSAENIYDDLIKSGVKPQQTFDVHIEIVPESEKEDSSDTTKSDKKSIKLTEKQAKDVIDDFKDIVINAVKQAQHNNPGSVPGEISRMVDEFLSPKVNWRELLASTVQSRVKGDYSFVNPSKKSWTNGFGAILPGALPEETIKVACAIDFSGSISKEQLTDFLSEVHGIMTTYPSFEVYVWAFDTRVSSCEKFTEDNIDELENWTTKAGGGTRILSNFEYFEQNEIDADILIIFTDLEDSSQNSADESLVETVWIINNPYNKNIKPPFGSFAHYSEL